MNDDESTRYYIAELEAQIDKQKKLLKEWLEEANSRTTIDDVLELVIDTRKALGEEWD